MLGIYKRLTQTAAPVLLRLLEKRIKAGKEDPARLHERQGNPEKPRPNGPLAWIHAASVGEAQSALILLESLHKNRPGLSIMVTTGTVTSADLMKKRLPDYAFHQFYPLDHPGWVASFLDHWQPDMAFWMESELWPNMLREIGERKIPAALVNARLSDKSFTGWRLLKPFITKVLSSFDIVLAQTSKDAAHYVALGAKKVVVTDNLKFSAAPLPVDESALEKLDDAAGTRPVWVYASTHDGEEDMACRIHKTLKLDIPDLLTIIVPRHPDRREEVLKTCCGHELKCGLRGDTKRLPDKDEDIYIADTMGELGLFYKFAPVAMIGRSFSNDGGGGHNPVEAAQLGCAVLTGPHVQYQKQLFEEMTEGGAATQVRTEQELLTSLETLLTDPEILTRAKERALHFAENKTHIIDRVMKELTPILETVKKKDAA